MADREAELNADKEMSALKKLQAAAGIIDKPRFERLDWMYEQSALQVKPDDETLMNMAVADSKSQDLEDVKKLGENTAGSLFLKSATRTTEDVLRKLREDPLFQIRRQEQAAKESMMANPLTMARLKQKAQKAQKKDRSAVKKAKKAAKKEKKIRKKLKKLEKKSKKAGKVKAQSSSSDSGSDSSPSSSGSGGDMRHPGASEGRPGAHRSRTRDADGGARHPGTNEGRPGAHPSRRSPPARRSRSPPRRPSPKRPGPRSDEPDPKRRSPKRPGPGCDDLALGPSSAMVSKRENFAADMATRKEAALASRGAPRRMNEEEKKQRLDQMVADAKQHDRYKDQRIVHAEQHEKKIEELETRMRQTSDQRYIREVREDACMGAGATVADRLRTQRHRRQKHINDPLERDD